jgi:AcrR family transcriptional regulator
LEPRKSPVQARSTASVDAILQATIQVLLQIGKERLTTTRVAARAGVSVGTLYQYFPNKSALLQAALKSHMTQVEEAVETTCRQQQGAPLRQMATALVSAFLAAKMRNAKTSVALYSVSSDVDGARIVQEIGVRIHREITRMLASTCDPLATDPELAASILQGMLAGVSRRILESEAPEKAIVPFHRELTLAACAYLQTCSLQSTTPLQYQASKTPVTAQ